MNLFFVCVKKEKNPLSKWRSKHYGPLSSFSLLPMVYFLVWNFLSASVFCVLNFNYLQI